MKIISIIYIYVYTYFKNINYVRKFINDYLFWILFRGSDEEED